MAQTGETPFFVSKQARSTDQHLNELASLVRLLVLKDGGSLPVTQIVAAFEGNVIGTVSQYREIYQNRYRRLIAAQVRAEFTAAGQSIDLSLTNDLSNYSQIDQLTQGGKVRSDAIWLRPEQSLYINTANTGASLAGARFRVMLFDPLSFAGYLNDGI